jgi:ferritin-like metal-binding protein YciE
MRVSSLDDLYLNKLQMIYDAELQGLQAMPLMAQRVTNPEVRQAFETHRAQTEQQVRRLEQLFQREGLSLERKECVSMRALAQETQQQMQEIQDPNTLDAFLIAAQQAVEHHEMAAYGTARSWAQQLGRSEAADLLQHTLDEEEQTDQLLSDIAERMVNQQAAERDVTPRATMGDAAEAGRASGGASGGSSARTTRSEGATDAT